MQEEILSDGQVREDPSPFGYQADSGSGPSPLAGAGDAMRIGVISDVHCNFDALETALEALAGEVDEVFIAGDMVYEYRFSTDVVSTLRKRGFPYVLGNHEMVMVGPGGERARTAPDVNPEDLRYVASLPVRIDCRIGGRAVTMMHGSPWKPFDRYLHENDPAWKQCVELNADVLLTGHTHVPMVKRFGRTLVVNPGSLGESREPGSRDLVSYAVVDLESVEAEIVRLPNPRLRAKV
jgi:putative phosphoesterase